MTQGSFIAVFSDGTHRSDTSRFRSIKEFNSYVREQLDIFRYEVVKFCYAYGTEFQQYTPGDFLHVFYGE